MNKKIAMVMALAAVVGVAGCAADNSGKGERGGKQGFHKAEFRGGEDRMQGKGGFPRGLERLNLSEEQKQKIQAILEANRPQQAANDTTRTQRMEQRDELVQAGQFDEAKARQMINERNQRHVEMELQHLKTQHAIFQVLTPAQQKQWQESQNKRAERSDRPGKPRQMPQQDRQAPQRRMAG